MAGAARCALLLCASLCGCGARHPIGRVDVGGDGAPGFRIADSTAGPNPDAAALADLDGDGRLDLVVANDRNDRVTVLRGRGDGSFEQVFSAAAGASGAPFGIALGDGDGDGRPDLFIANRQGLVLRGQGDCTFTPVGSFPGAPWSVVAGDLDGDGRLDLAAADGLLGSVSVLLGAGDLTYPTAREFGAGREPYALVAADLDGGGGRDLAVADRDGRAAVVLLADPAERGRLTGRVAYPLDDRPSALAAADLDGDGRVDLALPGWDRDQVLLLHGAGGGRFLPGPVLPVGRTPHAVASGDLDGDGRPDLAVANLNGNSVSLLYLQWDHGDGTVRLRQDLPAGRNPTSVALGDLDGDGRLDVLVTSLNDQRVRAFLRLP